MPRRDWPESPANGKLPAVSAEHLPASMKRPLAWLELLRAVSERIETRVPAGTELPWGVPQAEKLLAAIAADFDGEIAVAATSGVLGPALPARPTPGGHESSREGRRRASTHGRCSTTCGVIVVGGGTLTNPQVARFVPENGLIEMPGVQALVPAALRVKWQRPKPPAETGDDARETGEANPRGRGSACRRRRWSGSRRR